VPLQNRVTPRSSIEVDASRGFFMGNRGCLHDDQQRLAVRPATRRTDWRLRRWIICGLDFPGRKRRLMAPGNYTELFFLDEATALAAGHRPCHECRSARAQQFAIAWGSGNPAFAEQGRSLVARVRLLHSQRRTPDGSQRTYRSPAAELPAGAMVDVDGEAHLVVGGVLRPLSFGGYGPARALPAGDTVVLTPNSTVAALRAGYLPEIHPSAF
jgi:hypothetical protein